MRDRGDAVTPAGILFGAGPILDVEGWVGKYVVGLDARVNVAGESVTPTGAQASGVNTVDGEVHLRHAPGLLIEFLAVHGDLGGVLIVAGEELFSLNKHAAGTAAGVVNAALIWFKDLHQGLDKDGGV